MICPQTRTSSRPGHSYHLVPLLNMARASEWQPLTGAAIAPGRNRISNTPVHLSLAPGQTGKMRQTIVCGLRGLPSCGRIAFARPLPHEFNPPSLLLLQSTLAPMIYLVAMGAFLFASQRNGCVCLLAWRSRKWAGLSYSPTR